MSYRSVEKRGAQIAQRMYQHTENSTREGTVEALVNFPESTHQGLSPSQALSEQGWGLVSHHFL